MARSIPLTQGFFTLVDDEDYARLARYKWTAHVIGGCVYAVTGGGQAVGSAPRRVLHRMVLDLDDKDPRVADHISGNTLDNRRANLRACTRGDNNTNTPPKRHSTHGFKGLMLDPRRNRYTSVVTYRSERHWVGSSGNPIELALARDVVALRVQGEYAWLNFPHEIVEALDRALS